MASAEFKEVLDYVDGALYWKKQVNSKVPAGSRAGRVRPDSYRHVTYRGRKYLEHRLIFFMFNDYWPEYVDHIDRDKSNNKIENLRSVTASESSMNTSKYKGNLEGINLLRVKYQLVYKGRYIGRFNSIEEAICAREVISGL